MYLKNIKCIIIYRLIYKLTTINIKFMLFYNKFVYKWYEFVFIWLRNICSYIYIYIYIYIYMYVYKFKKIIILPIRKRKMMTKMKKKYIIYILKNNL